MKELNTVKHLVYEHKNWKRNAFFQLFKQKQVRRRFYQDHLREFYFQGVRQKASLEKKSLEELVDFSESVSLQNFYSRNGNLSPLEILCISAIAAHRKPKRLLEIGTFDGNTTLQLALNTPDDARIQTIDLPPDVAGTKEPVLDSDLQFIQDEKKTRRKFEESSVSHKVTQIFGDSTNYDFSLFAKEGLLDFIFIDGGHSYECVKSDTKNALPILSETGCILWHDFTPHFAGVFRFLTELSKELPLIHIAETNLVLYIKNF